MQCSLCSSSQKYACPPRCGVVGGVEACQGLNWGFDFVSKDASMSFGVTVNKVTIQCTNL